MATLPLGDQFHVFDTTLRDGGQREGIAYSVEDKLAVARLLDEYGVGFIEGGWPGAMPNSPNAMMTFRPPVAPSTSIVMDWSTLREPGWWC